MGKHKSTDPIRAAADALREKKGVAYGVAKLELAESGEGTHVEYFRGKDLVRWIEANPGKLDNALKEKPGRSAEETAAELIRWLFSRGFVYRTERKFKRPKPGRTRLVKWPRTLLLVRDQQWDADAFYAWRYDRPTSAWYYVAAVAVPVVVILACLFPLAPWWARIGLVYFLMAVLILILGLMGVRYLLFTVVWAVSGSSFWLFPNMMSDQVGILEAFKPVISFDKAKSIKDAWQARLATAVVVAGVMWVLSSHTPDLTHLKDDMAKAHDSFVQYMDTMYAKEKTFLNGTATPKNTSSSGTGARPGGGARTASDEL